MSLRPRIEVIHDDDEILVVNKPAGVLTIADRKGGESARDLLAAKHPELGGLRVVHRLDRDTSGVLVFARTLNAQRSLTRQLSERTTDKRYLAIVRGEPADDRGLIDAPLRPHPRGDQRMVVSPRGRASQTEWEVIERLGGFALLRCRLLTGRQHQIRVHLSHVGLPLLVDELYGSAGAFFLSSVKPGYRPSARHDERPLIGRQTLHAESIALDHPIRSERLTFSAETPKDFRAVLSQLRKRRGLA
ncbi:MAG TPA: RluA family pseudouridine synthase [Phycisphaerae bacterium]|nr:RluA family pseudouridine synthase [Phycisphaerae bacterium]